MDNTVHWLGVSGILEKSIPIRIEMLSAKSEKFVFNIHDHPIETTQNNCTIKESKQAKTTRNYSKLSTMQSVVEQSTQLQNHSYFSLVPVMNSSSCLRASTSVN